MKPSCSRLTCRAPNRFTPAVALWQHFVAPNRPFLVSHRLSSTATATATDAAHDPSSTQDATNNPTDANDTQEAPSPTINIKRTSIAARHETSRAASIAKDAAAAKDATVARRALMDQLMTDTRAAHDASEDYKAVVVMPISPQIVKDSDLPWALSPVERTMPGIDRLQIEIERFYQYSQPNHAEIAARRHVIQQVQKHARKWIPDGLELEVFGSERTGLAFATSDIDLRLREKMEEEGSTVSATEQASKGSRKIATIGVLQNLYWKGLIKNKAYLLPALRYARYPLISIQDRQSTLDIQIVLSQDTSVSREIMARYIEEHPYIPQLYSVIRSLFDVRGFSDVFRGGVGSYPLFMMIVASIKLNPSTRNDAAGALINFLEYFGHFDATKKGISLEPLKLFNKEEVSVMSEKTKKKIEESISKPLPHYMLCLRDPADDTNDLGRKTIAIKHVQFTLRQLAHNLHRHISTNTRHSLLGPLVGSTYMTYKFRRNHLRRYGYQVSLQLNQQLGAKAQRIREEEEATEEATKARSEQAEEHGLASQGRKKLIRRVDAKKRSLAYGASEDVSRRVVAPTGLDLPGVEKIANKDNHQEADSLTGENAEQISETEQVETNDLPVEEANSDAEKRSKDAALVDSKKETAEHEA